MQILLDECVTRKLKAFLPEFQVMTVGEMGYSGMKNGKLLRQAELAGFDLLLTIDKNIDSQQQIRNAEKINHQSLRRDFVRRQGKKAEPSELGEGFLTQDSCKRSSKNVELFLKRS